MTAVQQPDDDALLDRLQRAAFSYFFEASNPENGLIKDNSRESSPASIASVGFALSSYPVGVERGWISRADAAARTLRTLQFFWNSPQSEALDATGHKGFYYHFLDMQHGKRVWRCELSPIDTSILLAGALTASAYFSATTPFETEIRNLTDALYSRVDWLWMQDGQATPRQGWKPDSGFLHYGWEGYNEAIILYALGLGSPTYPLSDACYRAWTGTYQWENIYDTDFLYAGPLFIHQFSHAWIDFRGIQDPFMRDKKSDYFENSVRAVSIQREYARRNPHGFEGYGTDCWGLTACEGPGIGKQLIKGVTRNIFGYSARGVPYGPDDGTIAPWAPLASLPFTPAAALSALRHLCEQYPDILREGKLAGGFNPTLPGPTASGWVSDAYYGLDQGIVVLMIENYRSGLIWELIRNSPYIEAGLRRAGFGGGWMDCANAKD